MFLLSYKRIKRLKAILWCGSTGNNSKGVGVVLVGVVIRKVINDDRLVCDG